MNNRALKLVEVICDHFNDTQTSYGRPDPLLTPLAGKGIGREDLYCCTRFHLPMWASQTLYAAGKKLKRPEYIVAADKLVLFMVAVLRDPYKGKSDEFSKKFINASGEFFHSSQTLILRPP